ncbi:tudor domain-containing protein 7-like isoform X2 [Ornithodoros turicata]
MTETVQDVASMLHSVVSCEKDGIPLQRLEQEYQTLVGASIPFRNLGHSTLEGFIRSISDVVAIEKSPDGQVIVHAVVKPSTAHVARLVGEQKTATRPRTALRPSRHPRTGPSIRFASCQAIVNNGGIPSMVHSMVQPTVPMKQTLLQLNPLTAARRAMRPRTGLGILPQLRKVGQQELRGHNEMPPVPNNSLTGIDTAEPVAPSYWNPPRHYPVSPAPVTPQVAEEYKGKSYRDLVEEYAVQCNQQLSYNTLSSRSSKRGPLMWLSTLKLNNRTFNSYPIEKPTRMEAEEEAARRAVEALKIQGGISAELAVTPVSTLQEVQAFVERINELVSGKPNGLWNTVIPDVYRDEYRERIPEGWLDVVRRASAICISDWKEGRCILYPQPAGIGVSSQGDAASSDSETGSVVFPEPIALPERDYWDVFVTSAPSTDLVSFRLVDYSEQYEELANEMDQYYSEAMPMVIDPTEGGLYALRSEDSWLRVQLVELMGSQAECYFVDHGDMDAVDSSKLRELEGRFLNLPFQAVQCQLEGLAEFAEEKLAAQLLAKMVFGKVLVAEVCSREDPIRAVLYDTATAEDVNLNSTILKEMLTPRFPGCGEIVKANLCHVTPTGDLSVRLEGPSTRTLYRYMEALGKHLETNRQPVKNLSLQKIYACRDSVTGKFERVVVVSTGDEITGKVQVRFVDCGRSAFILQSELNELDSFEEPLIRLPYQALGCRLSGVLDGESWNEKAAARLQELAPQNLELLLKVTDSSSQTVELFKRIEPNNELVSINASLAVAFSRLEDKLEKQTKTRKVPRMASFERRISDPGRSMSTSCSTPSPRNSVTTPEATDEESSRLPPLPAPELPGVGQYLDINVTVAANPLNFVCQPWSNGALLSELMTDMQAFYKSTEGRSAFPEGLPDELLREGEFYAGHHSDDLWYRVLVRQVQHEQLASVYFVDYGDYGMLSSTELQPLWRRYRRLPVQAVHAQLSNVAPIGGDWNPVDCLSFRNIVENKQFVAVITSKEVDSTTGIAGAQRLRLRLIDTSTDVDIQIDRLLAKKGVVRLVIE